MKKSTLCFCIKDNRVLLAMKKRGFGSGKWNGYGGKVQTKENPVTAAVRELEEESGLIANEKDLYQLALIRFYFDGNLVFECFVYITHSWQGEPNETEEMRPKWYPISDLPFKEMWVADVKWIPLILNGDKIEAEVNFNTDGTAVTEFNYKLAEFN